MNTTYNQLHLLSDKIMKEKFSIDHYFRKYKFQPQIISSKNKSSTVNGSSQYPSVVATLETPRMKTEANGIIMPQERRCANYKPNIWSYDVIQSLANEITGVLICRAQAEKLKEEFTHLLSQVPDLSKPYIVDSITKLGLSYLFNDQIKNTLETLVSKLNNTKCFEEDIRATILSFRLLRQHGYNVSQDMFADLTNEKGPLKESEGFNLKGVLELFEASHLAVDGEDILVKAKDFSHKYLKGTCHMYNNMDFNFAKQVAHALDLPCHWRVLWFDVRHQIQNYEQQDENNPVLLELAKLNFNIVQAGHMNDLKEMSRWWRNLGLIENIGFARDRLVESFLWTVGVAYEPEHSVFRKCLTKVITFILVIDDVYDIYGSFEELECFTKAVERWDDGQVEQLPECMKFCLQALKKTTEEISDDIQKEKGWDSDILPYLKMGWADFCKALLIEAWWYNKSYKPSLEDYLRSAWISSSGPLLSLIALLFMVPGKSSEELRHIWRENQDLVHHISLIIRLSNDLETSAAELERGDAPSSILCYMEEANVTEKKAREDIKDMISSVWSKINMELISGSNSKEQQIMFVKQVINIGRVCQFIYHNGDGFGVQDGDTRKLIKSLLIEPLEL